MDRYRISKYNPMLRNPNGNYLPDDWTSFSDIGKMYDGCLLTSEAYLCTEGKYIRAILAILKCNHIKQLIIQGLEKRFSVAELERIFGQSNLPFTNKCKNIVKSVKDGEIIDLIKAEEVIRLILRDCFWCELIDLQGKAKMTFGYDLYVYLENVFIAPNIVTDYAAEGIFIECCK